MLFTVTIRQDLTVAAFGYSSESLVPGSPKPVIAECTGCGLIYEKEFRIAHKKHQCPIVKDGKKRCYKCEQWKLLSDFNPVSNGAGGVAKLCKVCRSFHPAVQKANATQYRRIYDLVTIDPTKYLRYRVRHFITRARSIGLPYDIDFEYMRDLWEKQNGLCYYSLLPMNGTPRNKRAVWNSPSIDKLVPSLGYIMGNVVWCLMAVNAFKGDLVEADFKEVLKNARWQTS